MTITEIQLFMLMQNQLMEIRSKGTMQLTRMVKPFKREFKKAVGLKANANALDVLKAVGKVYYDLGKVDKFYEYLNRPHNLIDSQPLVTPEMMRETYSI
jgi:hypothetical protein